jgi:hypothetical protein
MTSSKVGRRSPAGEEETTRLRPDGMRVAPSRSLTIVEALTDHELFGRVFQPTTAWSAWRVFLAALFGLPMSDDQVAVYRGHTGRQRPPGAPAREAWVVVGRRGGKSRVAALVAVWLACFKDYRAVLAPGEPGTLMVIAADRRQARVVFRYIEALVGGVPMLAGLVAHRTRESITLTNRVTIEVHTASFRAIRGYTLIGAVCDELAFWSSEDSANPDTEILAGLRPGMATVPGALLLCISSAYARRGALWEAYREHWGNDDDPVLVWKADTRAMNPTVDEQVIAEAYARDESAARAEYGAEFRRDLEDYVGREALMAVVARDRRELPPSLFYRHLAFVDPSGGSADSMTLAIAHVERDKLVLDALREAQPPFSPEMVVEQFVQVLGEYRIRGVTGDRYAGEWPRERFRAHGIAYQPADKAKSQIYAELLPLLNSGAVELLDHRRLLNQLLGLERRTSWGGRESVDHPPNAHDDVANAAAGALLLAWGGRRRTRLFVSEDRPIITPVEAPSAARTLDLPVTGADVRTRPF